MTEESPVDATEDALAELGRLDSSPSDDPFDPEDTSLSLAQGVAPAEPAPVAPTAHVIEDLYAEHPDIGGGAKFLRVVRKSPRVWRGVTIAGYIPPDLHEQLSSEDFMARYGGGTYDILVIGAMRDSLDDSGEPRLRTIRTLRLDFSGPPKGLGDMAPDAGAFGGTMQDPRGYSQVEITRMQIEERDRIRREQMQQAIARDAARTGNPGELITQIEQSADRARADTRESLSYVIEEQKRTIAGLGGKVKEVEEALRLSREQELKLQRDYAVRRSEDESKTITELRTKHDAESGALRTNYEQQLTATRAHYDQQIDFLRNEHERRSTAVATEHKAALEALGERRDREREARDEAHRVERDRMREDYERRMSQLAEDAKRREEYAAQAAKDRETSLDKAHDREMRSLRESLAMQTETIKVAEGGKVSMAERAAGVEVTALKNEMGRMGAEIQSKQAELDTLRARQNKSIEAAIDEACGLAERVGWGPAQGAAEKKDWKEIVAEAFVGAAQGVPQILKEVQATRVENQRAAAGARPVYTRQPAGLPGIAPPMQGPPPPQAEPPRRGWRAPRPGFGEAPRGTPPEAGTNPYAPPPYAGPPIAAATPDVPRAEPEQGGGQRVEPASAPPPPAFTYEDTPPPPLAPLPQEAAPPPMASAPAPAPLPVPAGFNVSPEAVGMLVQNVEMAVNTNSVEPIVFAKEIVAQLGEGPTAAILRNMSADSLCDNLAASKGGVLATHEGRTYMRKIWDEAGKLVGVP